MGFFNFRTIATVMAGAFLLGQVPAGAATITTTSFAAWSSSSFTTGAYSYLNFYPVAQTNYASSNGITLTPTGSTTAFKFTGMDAGSYYLAGNSSLKTLSSSTNAGSYVRVDFPIVGENAFLLGTTATAARPLTFSLSDGQTFTVSNSVFGISLSHSISWLQISGSAGWAATVSDFYYAASALPQDAPASGSSPDPTPEPATLLMTLSGGVLLLGGSRKFKARASHAR
jgi:hypothetical protein